MNTDFALLDDDSGPSRLYTGLIGTHEAASPAELPAQAGVLLADYEGRSRLLEFDRCQFLDASEVDALLAPHSDARLSTPHPGITREEFHDAVSQVKEHIAAGDTYQVNLSFRLHAVLSGDPVAAYRVLRRAQPVDYGALVRLGGEWVLSRSPELFVRSTHGVLTARPMKGTTRRSTEPVEDIEFARWLREDPKSRAENLMIVDLLRNDLSRVAATGSVRTRSLFDVEPYPSLWQLTSTITAELRSGARFSDVVEALFPCGSITGAPKVSTMRIIEALETSPRNLYTGAIGWLDEYGDFCTSVAIRTLTLDGTQATVGVGAGIVADSDPESEWQECLLKAEFLRPLTDRRAWPGR